MSLIITETSLISKNTQLKSINKNIQETTKIQDKRYLEFNTFLKGVNQFFVHLLLQKNILDEYTSFVKTLMEFAKKFTTSQNEATSPQEEPLKDIHLELPVEDPAAAPVYFQDQVEQT